MTRDSSRLVDEQDGEAEIFSALWTAAPSFPQLPPDATPELKALTIEVEDPKKVYSLHHGYRRHGFQVLVDRYINQLRYGCQDPRCSTTTCFTCRLRQAGSTPLRRYNATSARTLACYLASQDNPEKGLCQYAGTLQSKASAPARLRVSTKSSASVDGAKGFQQRSTRSPKASIQIVNNNVGSGRSSPAGFERIQTPVQQATPKAASGESSQNVEKTDLERLRSTVQSLERPVEKDHKSFIQNLFGTVAFRMLEWLSPKFLENLIVTIQTQEASSGQPENKYDQTCTPQSSPPDHLEDPPHIEGVEGLELVSEKQQLEQKRSELEPVRGLTKNPRNHLDGQAEETDEHQDEKERKKTPDPGSQTRLLPCDPVEATSHPPYTQHVNGTLINDVKHRNSLDLGIPKTGRINGHVVQPEDPEHHKIIDSQGIHSTKKSRKRLSSLTSPRTSESYQETVSHPGPLQSPTLPSTKRNSISKDSSLEESDHGKRAVCEECVEFQVPRRKEPTPTCQVFLATDRRASPQSLSVLSLEIIEFISDIFHEDWMRDSNEDFVTNPNSKTCLRRARKVQTKSKPEIPKEISIHPTSNTAPMWKSFIEQSLFYVLSSPKALLQTFSEEGRSLVDTQTLWYCMMRLIHVKSSLVFDSLWIAAADLYPPRELWPIYEWAKKIPTYEAEGVVNCSPDEAARLMSICLHALIAAVPYTRDSAQLFTLSRIRSCGLSSIQRRGLPSELVDLYLRTDDAFSDELMLRLARRLFAAIPVRRQYQELVGPNQRSNTGPPLVPDILELVLAPLNFLDIEVPPILAFTPEDREIHERRAPTLMIDWARTVMLLDWTGSAEVSADGAFGGALTMMSAIYEKRKSLLLGDVHFRTEYFADRLDPVEMPVDWLLFTPNKKTLHLLDYPYLFSPANLVTYFRAINFSRMSRSFEASNSMLNRIHTTMAPGNLMTDTDRREDLFVRLRTAVSKFLVLQIRRSDVLGDAFNHLWRREQRELSRPLKIKLGEDSGEEGSDSGGVQQEFFRLAIAEALNPDYGTFTIDERTRMTWFQPGSPQPLWKFELIGLIISLAVYNGLTLPVTFPKALYRKLLGAPVTELHHIEDGWPDLASGLTSLLEWDEKDGSVSDVFSRTYEFGIESFGQQISRDMSAGTQWPQFQEPIGPNPVDARLVDSENRNDYVSDYIVWLTDISIRPQFKAFQRGFLTCLDRRSLSLFDPDILQSVVEGVQEIDISELRRFTRYVGWDASHRTIKDFWSIVKKFDMDEKKKLLEFVTASDRVPVGGMRNLQFVIQRNGVGDIDGHLPTSYTCYGTLLLPEYSSKEILKEKLGMALENAKGFGFA